MMKNSLISCLTFMSSESIHVIYEEFDKSLISWKIIMLVLVTQGIGAATLKCTKWHVVNSLLDLVNNLNQTFQVLFFYSKIVVATRGY